MHFAFWKNRISGLLSQPTPVHLSAAQQRQLMDLLSSIGLRIVSESRGPVPLLTFGRRVLEHLDVPPPVPLPHFSAALKRLIQSMDHERLRIMSPTDMIGVGYVYNAQDPETWPVKSANR
jgi:hypothetical protein